MTVESGEKDCEIQWTEVQTKEKSVLIGSFYRPPNAMIDSLENLQSSMSNINEHNKEKPVFGTGTLPSLNQHVTNPATPPENIVKTPFIS